MQKHAAFKRNGKDTSGVDPRLKTLHYYCKKMAGLNLWYCFLTMDNGAGPMLGLPNGLTTTSTINPFFQGRAGLLGSMLQQERGSRATSLHSQYGRTSSSTYPRRMIKGGLSKSKNNSHAADSQFFVMHILGLNNGFGVSCLAAGLAICGIAYWYKQRRSA